MTCENNNNKKVLKCIKCKLLQPHQMQQHSPNCINYFLWLWSRRCYIFLRRCICKSLWLLSVNSVNVFKSFCIFALAPWPSLQCLESVGRTLGSSDTPTWSIQNILELLGLLKWKESLCKLSFCWSDGYCDWLCFSHLSLSISFLKIRYALLWGGIWPLTIVFSEISLLDQAFKVISFLQ